MKHLSINLWINSECPVRHGYTPQDDEADTTQTLRIGPLVIGWEVVGE